MNEPVHPASASKIRHPLSLVLYGLAGLALAAALLTLVYALTFRDGVNASLFLVSGAFGPVANQVIDMLVGGVQAALLFFAGVALLIGVLLFSAGKLSARSRELSQRIADLETRLATLESAESRQAA